jgi:hypothetical protein
MALGIGAIVRERVKLTRSVTGCITTRSVGTIGQRSGNDQAKIGQRSGNDQAMARPDRPVGAGLLANASPQPIKTWMTHRLRQQAGSYRERVQSIKLH